MLLPPAGYAIFALFFFLSFLFTDGLFGSLDSGNVRLRNSTSKAISNGDMPTRDVRHTTRQGGEVLKEDISGANVWDGTAYLSTDGKSMALAPSRAKRQFVVGEALIVLIVWNMVLAPLLMMNTTKNVNLFGWLGKCLRRSWQNGKMFNCTPTAEEINQRELARNINLLAFNRMDQKTAALLRHEHSLMMGLQEPDTWEELSERKILFLLLIKHRLLDVHHVPAVLLDHQSLRLWALWCQKNIGGPDCQLDLKAKYDEAVAAEKQRAEAEEAAEKAAMAAEQQNGSESEAMREEMVEDIDSEDEKEEQFADGENEEVREKANIDNNLPAVADANLCEGLADDGRPIFTSKDTELLRGCLELVQQQMEQELTMGVNPPTTPLNDSISKEAGKERVDIREYLLEHLFRNDLSKKVVQQLELHLFLQVHSPDHNFWAKIRHFKGRRAKNAGKKAYKKVAGLKYVPYQNVFIIRDQQGHGDNISLNEAVLESYPPLLGHVMKDFPLLKSTFNLAMENVKSLEFLAKLKEGKGITGYLERDLKGHISRVYVLIQMRRTVCQMFMLAREQVDRLESLLPADEAALRKMWEREEQTRVDTQLRQLTERHGGHSNLKEQMQVPQVESMPAGWKENKKKELHEQKIKELNMFKTAVNLMGKTCEKFYRRNKQERAYLRWSKEFAQMDETTEKEEELIERQVDGKTHVHHYRRGGLRMRICEKAPKRDDQIVCRDKDYDQLLQLFIDKFVPPPVEENSKFRELNLKGRIMHLLKRNRGSSTSRVHPTAEPATQKLMRTGTEPAPMTSTTLTRRTAEVPATAAAMVVGKNRRKRRDAIDYYYKEGGALSTRGPRRKRIVFLTLGVAFVGGLFMQQIYKHFDLVQIVKNCFRYWYNFCRMPVKVEREVAFVVRARQIAIQGMPDRMIPQIRRLFELHYIEAFYRKGKAPIVPSQYLANQLAIKLTVRHGYLLDCFIYDWEKDKDDGAAADLGETDPDDAMVELIEAVSDRCQGIDKFISGVPIGLKPLSTHSQLIAFLQNKSVLMAKRQLFKRNSSHLNEQSPGYQALIRERKDLQES